VNIHIFKLVFILEDIANQRERVVVEVRVDMQSKDTHCTHTHTHKVLRFK
jgi:hypothetical protein